ICAAPGGVAGKRGELFHRSRRIEEDGSGLDDRGFDRAHPFLQRQTTARMLIEGWAIRLASCVSPSSRSPLSGATPREIRTASIGWATVAKADAGTIETPARSACSAKSLARQCEGRCSHKWWPFGSAA